VPAQGCFAISPLEMRLGVKTPYSPYWFPVLTTERLGDGILHEIWQVTPGSSRAPFAALNLIAR